MDRRLFTFVMAVGVGCQGKPSGEKPTLGATGPILARIDDRVITVADLEAQIGKQDPYVQHRYSSIEKRKALLDNLVRFEVLAEEARRRGYDKDPEVVNLVKEHMVAELVRRDFESKTKAEDIPDAEAESYYKERIKEFLQPEEVRVSAILMADETAATKVAAAARALPKTDSKGFDDLVAQHSIDEDARPRAGDLTYFSRTSSQYPKQIVDAGFALAAVGDVSAPVKTAAGFQILRLTARKPPFTRSFAEVKITIKRLLHSQSRAKKMAQWEAEMRQKVKIEIFADKLADVKLHNSVDAGRAHP